MFSRANVLDMQWSQGRFILVQAAVLATVSRAFSNQSPSGCVHASPSLRGGQQLAELALQNADEAIRPHIPFVLGHFLWG